MLILFILCIIFSYADTLRSDYSSTGNKSTINTLTGSSCKGTWDTTYPVICPDDSWAYGYALMTSSNYGVINIILDCRNQTYDTASNQMTSASSVLVQYQNMGTIISALTKTTTSVVLLSQTPFFLRGINMRMWCVNSPAYTKGINEVKLVTSYFTNLTTSYSASDSTATWLGLSYCREGFALCGYTLNYNPTAKTTNSDWHYGMIDFDLMCCRICDISQGIYFDATLKDCAFCDSNCRQCYGSSTNCTACSSSYTLVGNTCTTTIVATTISNEFYTTYTLDGTWSNNFGTGVNLVSTCGSYTMIGGYPIFVSGKTLTKTVNLPAHTMLRIKFHFFKIGNFSVSGSTYGEGLVYVDGVLTFTLYYANVPNAQFYNADCGSGNLITYTWYLEKYITHSLPSVTVMFGFNSTTGYMGISRMTIETQSCDVTCQTCTGTAVNQCTSCPTGSYLTISSTCSSSCASPYYADPTTSTCVTLCPNMPPSYGNTATRTCVTVCPDNYYKDDTDRLCHSSCSNYGDPVSGLCMTTCPNGWYGDSTTHLCLPCDFNCQTCLSSATNCLTCKYSWLGGVSSCSNPSFISFLANNKFTQTTLSNTDVTSSGFIISNPTTSSNQMSTCGTYKLVGGYNLFGATTAFSNSYTGLSGHINARITFYLIKIDNWTNNNIFVTADGITIGTQLFTSSTDSEAYKMCGSTSFTEALRAIDIFFNHSSSTLSLSITNDLPSSNTQASWGIYQLSLTLFLCDSTCQTCANWNDASQCLTCGPGLYLQSSLGPSYYKSTCTNTSTYKYATNNTCLPCDSNCLTCSAATMNDCLSCSTTYLLLPPGPSACSSNCNIGYYPADPAKQCLICDISCKECLGSGSSSCTSCKANTYLQTLVGPNQCLNTCPSHTYEDSTTNVCRSCDSTCDLCFTTGTTQCKNCSNGLFLQSPQGPAACLSTCPAKNYQNSTNMTCLPCDSSCLSCLGPSVSECLSCSTGKVLSNTPPAACSSVCGSNSFFNQVTNVCELCDASCKTCSQAGPTGCLSCNSTAFLQLLIGPGICDVTCPSGYYPNLNDNICHPCYSNCVACSNGNQNGCTKCGSSLFLLNPAPNYCHSSCPSGFYADILTNNCLPCDQSCQECKNGTIKDCTLCFPQYYLQNINGTISNTSGKCVQIPIVTPLLKNTTHALSYLLIFSSNYSIIYNKYINNTNITIDGVSNRSYTYSITQVEDTDIYMIDFNNVTCSITNYPLMHVNLNPPSNMTALYNVVLSTSKLQNNFKYYYYITPSTWKTINQTTEAASTMENVIAKTFVVNNIMSAGSAVLFLCLVSMDTIRFLRYFEVNYPANVLSMFQSSLPTADIIPNFYLDVDPKDGSLPDIFNNYGVSLYSYNNNGNTMVEGLVYWLFGVLILVFVQKFKNIRNKYFKLFLILLSMVFIWSYSLSYFLSNYISISFYTLLGYRFCPMETTKGKSNLLFSLATGVFVLIFFPFIIIKIMKIRPQKISHFEKVNSHDQSRFDIKSPETVSARKSNEMSLRKKEIELSEEIPQKKKIDVVLENLDTPNSSSIHPLENNGNVIGESTPLKSNFREKVVRNFRKVSQFIRMSISKMKKAEDYPFDWRKSRLDLKFSFAQSQIIKNSTKGTTKAADSPPILMEETTLREGQNSRIVPSDSLRKKEESRFGTLHKDFKQETIWQSYFILWSLLKQLLYALFIATSFDQPYPGLICCMILEMTYILSIFFINPFKECSQYFQNLFNESCGMVAIFLAFYMSMMDKNGILDEELKMELGWGIVGANLMLIVMFLLRMLVGWSVILYQLGKELWKRMGTCKKNKVKNEKEGAMDEEKIDKGVFEKILEMEGFLR